jgi:hypothetical protein
METTRTVLRATAAAVTVVAWAGVARADPADLDLTLRKDPGAADAEVATGPPDAPWGFYRDRQGRVMQVSFDLGRRVWLGAGYAPRRLPTGELEVGPAAFDFGATYEDLSADGLTRYRWHFLEGEARVHPFGSDITALRFDLSHRYDRPLVRITTFFGEPERHDLFINVGFFSETMHLETAPRGIDGEKALTLGTLQATLDLLQSADMRSYLRLRAGPGVEMRFGPWREDARYVGSVPQATLEGNLIVGKRAFQQLGFRVRGDLLRSVSWQSRTLPGYWIADAQASYELIVLAINDQPVSLRLAGAARVRDDTTVQIPAAGITLPGWEWQGTAGFRVSFFSPPIAPPKASQSSL